MCPVPHLVAEIVLLAAVCFGGLSAEGESFELERARALMGTLSRVTVRASDSLQCDRAAEVVFQEMVQVDRLMSTYRSDSEISELNRDGAEGWVSLDPMVLEVLEAAVAFGEASAGAFDPAMLPLMQLWGFRGGNRAVPSRTALSEVLGRSNCRHLVLDPEHLRARFDRQGVQIDLGGIAKGYALDRATSAMRRAGATGGLVDLGGNLAIFGAMPDSGIGVADPRHPSRLLGVLAVQNAFVSTTGGYERHVVIDGHRYGHVLDPRTGLPVEGMLSVTVVASTGVASDVLSTAVFVLGPIEGADLLARTEGAEGIIVWGDGKGEMKVHVSRGLNERFVRFDNRVQGRAGPSG
jgi:thiamine biosynthesis lipoprotein